ncbi:hypothetical protein ABFG93_00545 [Pseudalkalibacillus hwajinpoensis]|uniref:hypothetical protein n=1 Tax=Guptibacillus hwajinpoensis TaxID=208199 RepID=UPI00325C11DA
MVALSALGGAAAYGLTNRIRNGNGNDTFQQLSQNVMGAMNNQQTKGQSNAGQGIDNQAIEQFTNAVKDDLI